MSRRALMDEMVRAKLATIDGMPCDGWERGRTGALVVVPGRPRQEDYGGTTMKTIRNLTILSGLSLALFALAVTGAKAQILSNPSFVGTFTVPAETHWGAMTLPAGDYRLEYGTHLGGTQLVIVADKVRGRTLGMILAGQRNDVKAGKNVLNCVREGAILYVRALEMPEIGESVHFKIPHGVEVRSQVIAKNHSQSGKTQLSEVAIRIEHSPTN